MVVAAAAGAWAETKTQRFTLAAHLLGRPTGRAQQMQQGTMQQQLMQNLINAARGQYDNFSSAPANKLALPLAALGAAPVPQTQMQSRQLGIMDYLTAGLSGIAGMPRFM